MIIYAKSILQCNFWLINIFFIGKKWKSLTPSERAPCVQEAERLRLKHMQVTFWCSYKKGFIKKGVFELGVLEKGVQEKVQ